MLGEMQAPGPGSSSRGHKMVTREALGPCRGPCGVRCPGGNSGSCVRTSDEAHCPGSSPSGGSVSRCSTEDSLPHSQPSLPLAQPQVISAVSILCIQGNELQSTWYLIFPWCPEPKLLKWACTQRKWPYSALMPDQELIPRKTWEPGPHGGGSCPPGQAGPWCRTSPRLCAPSLQGSPHPNTPRLQMAPPSEESACRLQGASPSLILKLVFSGTQVLSVVTACSHFYLPCFPPPHLRIRRSWILLWKELLQETVLIKCSSTNVATVINYWFKT